MTKIPPEIIRASIKTGSVYYFSEDSFSTADPHYFVVLNCNPRTSEVIILGCASSQIEKTLMRRSYCSPETLVLITPDEYDEFSETSIFDCNRTINRTIDEIMQKYSDGKLKIKTEMNNTLVDRLKQAVIASNQIEPRIKALL